jgi:hypothetical protein
MYVCCLGDLMVFCAAVRNFKDYKKAPPKLSLSGGDLAFWWQIFSAARKD